jgi:hypothetical protein
MKRPRKQKDSYLEALKKVSLAIAEDASKSARDRNAAVANGVKLAAIEHKISPAGEEDFFS